MKKIAIFDLDGTLINSIYDLADSVNAALALWDLPCHSTASYYTFVGNGMEHLVRTAMGDKGSDDTLYSQVRADFDRIYAEHCNDKTCAYDGLEDVLSKLESAGIDTAVLSNKAHVYVGDILKKNFPHHSFSLAWGQQDGIKRKPDGEGVLRMLDALGYDQSDCVYIGDSNVDVLTAQNAGVDVIGVLWGFRSEEELREYGAQNIVSTPEQLYNMIITL